MNSVGWNLLFNIIEIIINKFLKNLELSNFVEFCWPKILKILLLNRHYSLNLLCILHLYSYIQNPTFCPPNLSKTNNLPSITNPSKNYKRVCSFSHFDFLNLGRINFELKFYKCLQNLATTNFEFLF